VFLGQHRTSKQPHAQLLLATTINVGVIAEQSG
jgi:hypothetical protein